MERLVFSSKYLIVFRQRVGRRSDRWNRHRRSFRCSGTWCCFLFLQKRWRQNSVINELEGTKRSWGI